MHKIVNDICDLCSMKYWAEVDQKFKKENPKWFNKHGMVYSKYQNTYLNQRNQEYIKLNPGPCYCFHGECWSCGDSFKICHEHLLEIISDIEKFDG